MENDENVVFLPRDGAQNFPSHSSHTQKNLPHLSLTLSALTTTSAAAEMFLML